MPNEVSSRCISLLLEHVQYLIMAKLHCEVNQGSPQGIIDILDCRQSIPSKEEVMRETLGILRSQPIMTDVVSAQVIFVSCNDDLHQVRAKTRNSCLDSGNLLTKKEMPILQE